MEENKSNEPKKNITPNVTQKVFFKEKKEMPNIVTTIVVSIVCTVLGCIITFFAAKHYLLKDNNTNTNHDNTNITYQIEKTSNPVIAIAKKAGPSIVGVRVTYISKGLFGSIQESDEEGSGIIYSEDGYIITNYHVIESAIKNSTATVTVTFANSEEELEATIVGYDAATDIAVIKVEKTGLTPAEFGKSGELEVGELAVAIGNPLGQEFAGSVTVGYVSALNRKITTDGRTYKLVQTDAAINPGNSGGALVNSQGQVIGINTVKVGSTGASTSVEGLGFAIPIDDALPIVKELITNKKIVRPYIGIGGIELDKTTAERNDLVEGIYVEQVMSNSPASSAGIQRGDVIIGADDQNITTMEELNNIKNAKQIGDTIKLKIYRGGKEIEIVVTLGSDDETSNNKITN